VLGAYVAYYGSKRAYQSVGEELFINLSQRYPTIGVAMIVVGTVTWGYADLIL
jgi:hypothetical protein